MPQPSDLTKSISFLTHIGIPLELTTLTMPSFFEGVWLQGEILCINPKLASVGDIFHEAGHLAVIPSQFREYIEPGDLIELCDRYDEYFDLFGTFDKDGNETPMYRAILQAGETEAIAWSYAATLAAGVDPSKLFESESDGDWEGVLFGLKYNSYLGINGLHHGGMCNMRKFPAMKRWLQE